MKTLKSSSIRTDVCVFHRKTLWPVLYVDDIIIIGREMADINTVKRELAHHFDMKDLGVVNKFLEISFISDTEGA